MANKRVHLIARGRVQGVCFRAFTESAAKSLGLTGWVRNTADGSVEIVAEGAEEDLTTFTTKIKKGPPAARVAKLEENWEEARGEFSDFDIVYWNATSY